MVRSLIPSKRTACLLDGLPSNDHSSKKQELLQEQEGQQEACTPSAWPSRPPCQPLGNLLARESAHNARNCGLGRLGALPDEILIGIFSELKAADLIRLQAVSHAFYAFSRTEGQWKHEFILRNAGKLEQWRGSWRRTYLHRFCNAGGQFNLGLPTDTLQICDVYSDALYIPYLAARYDPAAIASSSKFADNITRIDGSILPLDKLTDTPLILTNLMESWSALRGPQSWSLSALASRFPAVSFRAEAVLSDLSDYLSYHNHCLHDESPLYIFDADFVEKTEAAAPGDGLHHDFDVPHVFQDDLFSVLGDQRPNYRWLIAGPARSGSTFHCDPNATSAWNAVVTGRKLWILFPPHVTPPGVFVSEDQAEVHAPLSLAEWLMNYYHDAKRKFGPYGSDRNFQNTMLEGICNPGEVFYVPSGWWHLVINLEDSIAVTQNFVSRTNLDKVLLFLRHRAEQVSGFSCTGAGDTNIEDESGGGRASNIFEAALRTSRPELYYAAVNQALAKTPDLDTLGQNPFGANSQETAPNVWHKLQMAKEGHIESSTGFSFDFDFLGSPSSNVEE